MENKTFNETQSLELITRMIQETRTHMERHAGVPFLVWGYVTVIVTLAVWFALTRTQNPTWNLLWFALPALGMLLTQLTDDRKSKTVVTFIDRIIRHTWLVLGCSAVLVSLLTLFSPLQLPILFIILLLMSIGTILTGAMIRFRLCIASGILGILLSTLCLWVSPLDSCLVFAAAFVVMQIIPGHILNYQSRKQCHV
ncbi:MAG: hypothetical protein RSB29_06315 [Alistipes sp.]